MVMVALDKIGIEERVISLHIPGKPCAKQRPRVTKSGIAYTPKKTRIYESYVMELFVSKYPAFQVFEGPVEVKLLACFGIPKSWSQKKKALHLGTPYPKRPDVENVSKTVLDALNGLAYRDDAQVAKLKAEKIYSELPMVHISIKECR